MHDPVSDRFVARVGVTVPKGLTQPLLDFREQGDKIGLPITETCGQSLLIAIIGETPSREPPQCGRLCENTTAHAPRAGAISEHGLERQDGAAAIEPRRRDAGHACGPPAQRSAEAGRPQEVMTQFERRFSSRRAILVGSRTRDYLRRDSSDRST